MVGPTQLSAPGIAFTPAKPNETIMLYGFGFGLPGTALINGSFAQSGALLQLPAIQVGGVQAPVGFAGLVNPGLYQFNVTIPPSLLDGDNLVTCTFSGSRPAHEVGFCPAQPNGFPVALHVGDVHS